MDLDTSLYHAALDPLRELFLRENPVMASAAAQDLAEQVVDTLVREDLLAKPEQCQYRNASGTVDCDNLAPLTKQWCYDHSGY